METISGTANWPLDALLALTLLWVGWRVLTSPDLFKAIVFFISLGLLLALSWVRLKAPDVALAEAAIGAGLTGALLLAALARLRQGEQGGQTDSPKEVSRRPDAPLSGGARTILISLSAALFIVLSGAFLSMPMPSPGLEPLIEENLSATGVANPVTAVLLNFRGYDTLLEMGVLFLAVVAVWSLSSTPMQIAAAPDAILRWFVRLLIPIAILVSAYLLWIGAYAPGGAFQAGAVLAAAAILVLLAGDHLNPGWSGRPLRVALAFGLGSFVAVGATVMSLGYRFLEYPPGWAGNLILLIEVAATVSIGAALAAVLMGGQPQWGERR